MGICEALHQAKSACNSCTWVFKEMQNLKL